MDFTKHQLSNSLTLIGIPMASVASATALLMVRVGSRNETSGIRGLTHFLEHMPFKGTQKYPTTLELSSVVDSVGAEFNAFTGKEYTAFYVKSAASHLPLSLEILSELVFHPLIESTEIEKEKGVIVEEINMYEDQPMAKVVWNFESLLYGNTPLGWESIGTKQTVKSLAKNDFVNYLAAWYRPENMVLGIAGASQAVEAKSLVSLVDKFFGHHAQGDKKATKHSSFIFKQAKPVMDLSFKKTEQAHLCLGVRTFGRMHKDRYVLSVLATILGGNMSSRLFTEVREKRGLAYYVKTGAQSYLDNGYLVTRAGTDIAKADDTVAVILDQYAQIAVKKVDQKELVKAKEYLKGKLVLELEDSEEQASLHTEDYLLEGQVNTLEDIIGQIEKVTTEDVKRVAKDIFVPEGLNLSIIGPFRHRQKFEKLLK